jgi:MFS family permease
MKHHRSPLFVTTLIAGALFMENLDGTIIATALPQMARSFHIGAVRLNIGMTAYLLTLAVLIPISGWVADRFGARSVFATAIAVFTLASLLCGISHTLTEFTLMRILQGFGGAMMVPVGRLIVLRNTPKDQLTQAIAYITWPGLTALVLGPPVGGFITTYTSWHWIFFINLPLECSPLPWPCSGSRTSAPTSSNPSTGSPSCSPASPPAEPSTPWRSSAQRACTGSFPPPSSPSA